MKKTFKPNTSNKYYISKEIAERIAESKFKSVTDYIEYLESQAAGNKILFDAEKFNQIMSRFDQTSIAMQSLQMFIAPMNMNESITRLADIIKIIYKKANETPALKDETINAAQELAAIYRKLNDLHKK